MSQPTNMRPSRARRARPSDVKPWISEVLGVEHWYGDGYPRWGGREKSEEAVERRNKAARFLRRRAKDSGDMRLAEVAERLLDCAPENRCMSGACPECNRALQRYFVAEAVHYGGSKEMSDSPRDAVLASLIADQIPVGRLSVGSLEAAKKRARRVMTTAGVAVALGGIDISLNEDRIDRWDLTWSVHFWFLTYGRHWESATKDAYQSPDIPRPLMIRYHDGRRRGLAYALKTDFVQRINFIKTTTKNGKTRTSRNTIAQRMSPDGRAELLPFLDREGLAARVFLIGVRPVQTAGGVVISPIDSGMDQAERSKVPVE
jgi:hypothetical protein